MKEQKEVNENCNKLYRAIVHREVRDWRTTKLTLDVITKLAVKWCSPKNKYN